MNPQDLEVELRLLQERQKLQSHRLKDVDECCGKLKGSTSAEFKMIGERFAKIEQNVDNNCHDVELEVRTLEERVNTNKELIDNIESNLSRIRYLIYMTILTSLAGILIR